MENNIENRIPKIIHYAWFGRGEKSKVTKNCIDSWKKKLADYQFIEWNEDNFDLDFYQYAREAYDNKKYAYVTDIVRLHVLYYYGGIYMDSDVEVLKNFDDLLLLKAFSGFQSMKEIPTGTIGAEKGNKWIKEQLEYYNMASFNIKDINNKMITNVDIITKISLNNHGLILNNKKQELKYGMTIFPIDYFCAKNAATGEISITENTYTIHHFAGSWITPKARFHKQLYRLISKLVGGKRAIKLYKLLKK